MNTPELNYTEYRLPPEIIGHTVWLCHRFCLNFRDAEDLLAQRGITVFYETIRLLRTRALVEWDAVTCAC